MNRYITRVAMSLRVHIVFLFFSLRLLLAIVISQQKGQPGAAGSDGVYAILTFFLLFAHLLSAVFFLSLLQ